KAAAGSAGATQRCSSRSGRWCARWRSARLRRSGAYGETLAAIVRMKPDAVLVPSDPDFFRERHALVDLAVRTRTPASYEWREFVETGGLMSYGSNLEDLEIGRASCRERV